MALTACGGNRPAGNDALRGYAVNGDVPALKTFAGDIATVVEGHLKHVSSM